MKKKRLLIVGNFYSAKMGVYRSVCEDLAEHLQDRGWTVVATSHRPGRIWRLVDKVLDTWKYRHSYDVAQVDVYSGPAFLWAEAVCAVLRHARKPYVLSLHGGNLPAFSRRWPGRVRRLLRSAAVVTTPSRYLLEHMRAFRADLRLLPNPLDIGRYPFRLRAHPRPRLVWLRAFHNIYNPTLAPQVLARLNGEFPDLHLTMVGPDKGDGSFQATHRTAKTLGVMEHIHFPGGVPKAEVPAWLDSGDIFINTTNIDNTPVSVMEAMACGMCIVSTDVGGIPYLLEHEQDALLVPAGNAEAMAEAVRRVLTEPGLAERLSQNARAKAEGFDWSVILPAWEQIFLEVLSLA